MRNRNDENVVVVKKGGFLGKFIALILGFLFGIIATVGTVAGVGYYVSTQITIKEGFEAASQITGSEIKYTDYITDEYAEKTLVGLVGSVTDIIKDVSNNNGKLQAFADITPQVNKAVDGIVNKFSEFGIEMDTNTILDTNFSDMVPYVQDCVYDAELGKILSSANLLDKTNPNYDILMNFAYGVENREYTFGVNGEVQMMQRQIAIFNDKAYDQRGSLLPGTVANVGDGYTYTENSTTYNLKTLASNKIPVEVVDSSNNVTVQDADAYLVTDSNNETVFYKAKTINILIDKNSESVFEQLSKDLKINDLMGESDSAILQAIGDWNINDLTKQYKIESLKIVDIIGSTDSSVLQALKDFSIGDLNNQEKINSIKIVDVIGSTGSSVLQALKDFSIGDLSNQDKINSIKLIDVIGSSSSSILSAMKDFTIGDLSNQDKINNINIGELISATGASSSLVNLFSKWTIGDLNNQDKINSIEIGELLSGANLLNKTSPNYDTLMNLAYGSEGIEFHLDATDKVIMNQKKLAVAGGKVYDQHGYELKGTLSGTEGNYIFTTKKETVYLKTIDGKIETKDGTPIMADLYLAVDSNDHPINYTPRTINDLNDPDADPVFKNLAKTIKIKDIITDPDSVIYQKLGEWSIYDFTNQNKINSLTIGDLIDTSSDKLLGLLADKKITELSTAIDDLKLQDIIDIDLKDPNTPQILKTLAEKSIKEISSTINTLTLGQAINITEDSHPLLKKLKNSNINNLANEITTQIDSLKLNEIIDITPTSSPILIALGDKTISKLGDEVKNLKLGQVIKIDTNSHVILQKLANTPIDEMASKINSTINELTFGEIINIDDKSPLILQSLKKCKTKDLSTTMNNLKFSQIISNIESNKILKHLKNSTLETVVTDMENLTIQQVFGDEIYTIDGSKKVLTGPWKYLLTENGIEKQYKIGEMNKLITNMTNNMQKATLSNLNKDGIITIQDTLLNTTLNKSLLGTSASKFEGKNKMGDLTIIELMDYVNAILLKIEHLSIVP